MPAGRAAAAAEAAPPPAAAAAAKCPTTSPSRLREHGNQLAFKHSMHTHRELPHRVGAGDGGEVGDGDEGEVGDGDGGEVGA